MGLGARSYDESRTPDVRNYLPPKNRKKTKGKRKNPRRAGRRQQTRGPQVTKVPGGQFYADAERLEMKYADSYMLVQGATGGTLTRLVYKINSLFQVNQTAGAGSPQGTTSLTTKYQRYMVLGSRIHWRMRGLAPGGTYGSLGALGVVPNTSMLVSACLFPAQAGAVLPTTMIGCADEKYASQRFEWPRDIAVGAGSVLTEASQINPRTVWQGTKSMSVKKLDADPDPRQVEYTAAFGADPARLSLWVFSFQDVLADIAGEKPWLVEVELYYDVYAFDRVTVGDTLQSAGPLRVVKSDHSDEKKSRSETPVLVPHTRSEW